MDFYEILRGSFNNVVYNPSRNNLTYIDFEELKSERNLLNESEIKYFMKKTFQKIIIEAEQYFERKGITPKDYINLKTKTNYNYIQYKKKCINQQYEIPKFLMDKQINLLNDLQRTGNKLIDLEEIFKKFPTFDKKYIYDIINENKLNKIDNNNNTAFSRFCNKNNTYGDHFKYTFNGNKVEIKKINLSKYRTNYLNKNKTNNNNNNSYSTNKIKHIDKSKDKDNVKNFSENICNKCKFRKINIVFGDCKHKYICEDCLNNDFLFCPICEKKIKKFIKIYREL